MEHSSKQPQLLGSSTEDINFKMRRSFSWDRAFFTSDGFLDPEELSSMIDGGDNDVKHQLQKTEEIETLEAKLFEEIEASTKKSTPTSNDLTNSSINVLSGKRDSQAKNVAPCRAAPIKTPPIKSSPLPGISSGNNVKSSGSTPTKRNMSSKTAKATADSPSKTPPGITTTKNKVTPANRTWASRTSPASPISSGSSRSSSSSSPTSAVKRHSSRASSVPRRSLVNNEKSPAINARRTDDRKTGKPTCGSMAKIPSSISLKIKPPPLNSHPPSPLGTSVQQRSKSTLKNYRTGQTPDQNGKQPTGYGIPLLKVGLFDEGKTHRSHSIVGFPKTDATQNSKTGSPNDSKARKLPSAKIVAANTGLKPNFQKTITPGPKSSKKHPRAAVKSSSGGMNNILLVSPEVMDIKGKLNALKMEIDMQKKDKCKEIKMALAERGKGESSCRVIEMNNQST